jgi:hypothetical protein
MVGFGSRCRIVPHIHDKTLAEQALALRGQNFNVPRSAIHTWPSLVNNVE